MPRGSKSVNRPPTPEPEDQQRELTLEEKIRLKVTPSTSNLFCYYWLRAIAAAAADTKRNRAKVAIIVPCCSKSDLVLFESDCYL